MRWRVAVVVVVQFVGGCVRLIDKNRIAIVSTGSTARLQNQRGTGRGEHMCPYLYKHSRGPRCGAHGSTRLPRHGVFAPCCDVISCEQGDCVQTRS